MQREIKLLTQEGDIAYTDSTLLLEHPSSMKILEHETRQRIITLLAQQPLYPAEIAQRLGLHEQKVYYHIKQLHNAHLIEIAEKKEVRGTIAKRYTAHHTNFTVSLRENWKPQRASKEKSDSLLDRFLNPFITKEQFSSSIIVGSPDPHGPHKARARDSHYAVDLALFLGNKGNLPNGFVVNLDVDTDLETTSQNLIIVGGPVTNLLTAHINRYLDKPFSESPWGISGTQRHTDDSAGIVAKLPNPYNPSLSVLAIAGIRYSGTKAAVIALTRFPQLLLRRYSSQKRFCAVIQGYDLDGDGRIDDVELLE